MFFLFGVLMPLNNYAQDAGSGIHSLLPIPQNVSLSDQVELLDDSWSIETNAKLGKNDPAYISLVSGLKERFGLGLTGSEPKHYKSIQLIVRSGSVTIGDATDTNRSGLQKQAYQLNLEPERINIQANDPQGLFYAVQTFIQCLQSTNGKTYFNIGEIKDWPDLELRIIYWDDAHHLERLDAMKKAILQASYFKINALALKLEGHFQYESAKPLIEPYAYTPLQYQELTDYAKAHYIELIPYLDGPAHVSFILKHPAYKHLRALSNSNYELCVTDPDADELMLGMFDNLMEANKGGKYLLFSTDEAYYVGKNESEKNCAEALGGNGKLLAEYITRIGNKLQEKGRTSIIWAEYPLTPQDINLLPSHIINGVYNDEWAPKFKEQGIRQLIYTSVQGVEPLFPNYYKLPSNETLRKDSFALTDDELQQGGLKKGRVYEVLEDIKKIIAAGKSDFMGVIVAAWGDAGLNPETFWLGYATGTASGWNSKSVTSQNLTNRFYNSFYGTKIINMDKVYQLLSSQAQFWEASWDWELSDWRTPILGNSYGIFDIPQKAKDQTLPALPVPSGIDLSLQKDWNKDNSERLMVTEKFLKENNELLNLLNDNITRVTYQQHNLLVLLSVAQLCRQNLDFLLNLQNINKLLKVSSDLASSNPEIAVSMIDMALDQLKASLYNRNEMLSYLTTVWYQDWYPRVAEANGRKYLEAVDDIKDHLPVRSVDMSYLIYRQLKYPLSKWAEEVINSRNMYAKRNHLPVRIEVINWERIDL